MFLLCCSIWILDLAGDFGVSLAEPMVVTSPVTLFHRTHTAVSRFHCSFGAASIHAPVCVSRDRLRSCKAPYGPSAQVEGQAHPQRGSETEKALHTGGMAQPPCAETKAGQ